MSVPVAIVDFSWCLYKFRQAYKDIVRTGQDGKFLPAGHVYGTIRVIKELSQQYKAVILAVDSRSNHRYKILPEYKSGRHSSTGDPYEDYPIMSDLLNILKICTYSPNVFYIKHEGMESDDIIASWIRESNTDESKELSCYFNDVDILQVRGRYHWFRSFHEPEVDRRAYILNKFGLDLDYLPVWWKVIRGDASDCIPAAMPRFPSKKLREICLSSSCGFDYVTSAGDVMGCWTFLPSDLAILVNAKRRAVERNICMVYPMTVPVSDLKLKRFTCSLADIEELLGHYEIRDCVL